MFDIILHVYLVMIASLWKVKPIEVWRLFVCLTSEGHMQIGGRPDHFFKAFYSDTYKKNYFVKQTLFI